MSSNPTPNPNADLLLQAGINAARAGDKPTAREKLRQLVELDPQSEKGWYWLAAVAETIEEKRICLGNVIVINPNNEKAKQLLEQLSFATTGYASVGGSNLAMSGAASDQRRLILIVAGVVVVLLVLMIVLFGNRGDNLPVAAFTESTTALAEATGGTSTLAAGLTVTVIDETATSIVETQLAQVLPTLPPTWTPEVEATPRGTLTATPLPDAPDLPGRIVVQYGKPLTLDGFLPLGEYNPNTREFKPFQPLANRRGDYGRFVPVNQELVYGRYVSGGRPQLIMFSVNLISGREVEIGTLYNRQPPIANQKMVSISPNGTGIVFVGNNVAGENDATSDVYYLPYTFINANATATPTPSETPTVTPTLTPTATFTPNPDPSVPTVTPPPTWTPEPTFTPTGTSVPLALRRVTAKDSGVNTDPVFSPDGMQIAYVSDRTSIGQLVTDIFIVPVNETFAPERNLTNDGKELIEAAPDWSPDGSLIVYQAAFEGSQVNRLYLIKADGTERRVLVENFGNCTRPHFSPDGKWVVFTSDRTQKTELYVVEVASGEIFQISAVADTIVATDWGN